MGNLILIRQFAKNFKKAFKNDLDEARKVWDALKGNDDAILESICLVLDGRKISFRNEYIAAAVLLFARKESPHFFKVKEAVLTNIVLAGDKIEIEGSYKTFLEILLMREDVKHDPYESMRMEKYKELLKIA